MDSLNIAIHDDYDRPERKLQAAGVAPAIIMQTTGFKQGSDRKRDMRFILKTDLSRFSCPVFLK